ncbi:uncharacterized protein LOC113146586 [Cyclospora cayetanensis]|uniref:Uncharacterized protein LOC113146586 n=1 Tax=Cyclospora cayetanensis TaxID=88456 RepID=A0A6P6RQV5_9EIME|nr:uncharacterized protein LOC113146586 [Cyclospora cayetanensis]
MGKYRGPEGLSQGLTAESVSRGSQCGLRDPWASTEGGFQDRTPVEERAAQRRPLDFRYVAFRNPLASVSDEEFFISLARTAHGWCAPQADIPGDNTLRGHGAFALPISRPQKMGDVEIPLSSLKAGRPADSSTLLSRTRLGSNSQLRQPRAAAVLAPPPTAAVAAPAKGFAAGCLPPNVVALDRLGLRKRIARDERLCMSYATKIQVLDTLNLTDFSPHTQTTGTKARCLRPRIEFAAQELRDKLHTEIALKHVIEDDEKRCLEAVGDHVHQQDLTKKPKNARMQPNPVASTIRDFEA